MLRSILLATFFATGLFAQPGATVFTAAGSTAESITQTVQEFRDALGPLNSPGPGGVANGRREINWDGVPAQFSAPNNLPADFFNVNSVRGALLSSNVPNWTAFQVSANAADGSVRFNDVHAGYSSLFRVFSEEKLFSSIGSQIYDVDFVVPGTDTPGVVMGFGAVFTNVALSNTTLIEYFSPEGVSLGRFFARPAPRGLSFVGAIFPGKMIAKVRITPGNTPLGAADDPANKVNVVAADDFIYGEPASRCTP